MAEQLTNLSVYQHSPDRSIFRRMPNPIHAIIAALPEECRTCPRAQTLAEEKAMWFGMGRTSMTGPEKAVELIGIQTGCNKIEEQLAALPIRPVEIVLPDVIFNA